MYVLVNDLSSMMMMMMMMIVTMTWGCDYIKINKLVCVNVSAAYIEFKVRRWRALLLFLFACC